MNWMALLAIIVSIVVLYFVGTIITSPFVDESKDSFYDTFVKLIVGFLTVTTVYAIVKTGGNTVQLGLLLLGAFYIVRKALKKDIRSPIFKISLVGISTACAVGLFFFIYYGCFYYNNPVNNIFHADHYVYAFNSYNNQLYGIEAAGIYLDGMPRATPYHYIEGWLCAFIANIFHLNYLETFSICIQCIFSSIVIIGLIAYARTYTDKLVVIIFASLTLFLSAFLLDYSPIRQHLAIGENCKDLVSGIFIIGFIYSIRKGNANYLWLLCLPIANAALTPIIMSSLFIFAFCQYFKSKDRKRLLENLLLIIISSIFIALFYILQHSTFPEESSDSNIISTLFSSYSIKDFLYMTYRTLVNYAMYLPYFIPLVIIFIVKRNVLNFLKSHGDLIAFLVVSAICGLLCHYMYYPIDNYDSGQLDTLVTMILMDLLALTSFLYVFQKVEHKVGICIFYTFIAVVSIYNVWVFSESIVSRRRIIAESHDMDYRNNILDYFSKYDISHIGARMISGSSGSAFKNTCDLYQMSWLGGTMDGLAALCLSQSNLSEEQSHWNSIIPQSNTFNGYLSQLKQDYDLDSVQVDFIKKYNLGYMVVPSGYQLSDALAMLVDTTFVDGKTGERFMFLKR